MPVYTAKIKVVSKAAPNEEGKWLDITYSQNSLEKLNVSTSWNQTVDIFKPLVPDDYHIVQINISCEMELQESHKLLRIV